MGSVDLVGSFTLLMINEDLDLVILETSSFTTNADLELVLSRLGSEVHLIHLDPMLVHELPDALKREPVSIHSDLDPPLAAVLALPIIHILPVLFS